MDKITVIIPVYKVEPYLRQCLDSVVNQTYRNLEIIVVDDGSPDNCGEICDEYAVKDKRIYVIHEENRGLSAARNNALKYATGDWISFVDSDDWCELDLYERVIRKASVSRPDIIMYSLFKNNLDGEELVSAFSREFETSDRDFIFQLQLSALNHRYTPYHSNQNWYQGFPWDKLYKASLIKDYGLRFAENVKAHEDVIFNIHAFQFATKVTFLDQPLYHWRMNPNSIGHKYTPNRIEIDKNIYTEMLRVGEMYNLPQQYYSAIDVRIVNNTIMLGRRCFFHPDRKEPLLKEIKFATEILHSEPFYTAYKRVDRKKLGKIGKFVTLAHSGWLLYWANVVGKLFKLN